jgi:hypothetical protein
MSMSTDRVRFKIDPYSMSSETKRAWTRAFGCAPPAPSVNFPSHRTIICRPSQFARFLIYRNDEGGRNGFKELEPELFTPEEVTVIDVSRYATKC